MSIGVFSSVIVSFDASFCSLCLLKITHFSKGETAFFLHPVGRRMPLKSLLSSCNTLYIFEHGSSGSLKFKYSDL